MSEYPHPEIEEAIAAAEARLAGLDEVRGKILAEIESLKAHQHLIRESTPVFAENTLASVTNLSPAEEKIALFRRLFRGREEVYPRRWESRNTGKSGYQPACRNEWITGLCGKPQVKCGACPQRDYLPVTDAVIRNHLSGSDSQAKKNREGGHDFTIGVYPLLPDETCRFLAMDFDKQGWMGDVAAFLNVCKQMNVPAALERSRSGNGGHVWLFFSEPIPATLARRLGTFLLTETMEQRPEIGLDSYDRLFPNQDTMPKGGLGNLIALPLQKKPRDQGNTLFLNDDFIPFDDQWEYLSSLELMSRRQVETLVEKGMQTGRILGAHLEIRDDDADTPWTLLPSQIVGAPKMTGPFPGQVTLLLGNQIYIEKIGLPPSLRNRIIRLAAFPNPEFYKAQAMRMPTYDKPRLISCAEEYLQHLALPRGCLNALLDLLQTLHIQPRMVDERNGGQPLHVTFRGVLRPEQQMAFEHLLPYETGVLAATTAFGKTIVAISMIARRGVNTLILVHRRQILDQWLERLETFLEGDALTIGRVGDGKRDPSGMIDVALIQSLHKKTGVDDSVAQYGHLVVDECHHLSAVSFENVARRCKAKYVLGLSATVARKDGHHPIIFMQCGPVRFKDDARRQADARPFAHHVIPRKTGFRMPQGSGSDKDPSITDIYAALVADEKRNDMIFDDVLKALEKKRSPVVITERKEHLHCLAERFSRFARNVIVMKGGMGPKQRKSIAEKIASIPDEDERLILATGRYLGEGFDDPRLDTLFLTLPISWKGTLAQYAGRLHRAHDGKSEVIIYDYVDETLPMTMRMFQKRRRGYHAIGYRVEGVDK